MKQKILTISIVCFSLFVLYFNLIWTIREYHFASHFDTTRLQAPGSLYEEFIPYLQGVREAGYITERSLLSESFDTKHFFFAQYALAPVALRVADKSQPYLIIETSSWIFPIQLLDELNAELVHTNSSGTTILARRKEP